MAGPLPAHIDQIEQSIRDVPDVELESEIAQLETLRDSVGLTWSQHARLRAIRAVLALRRSDRRVRFQASLILSREPMGLTASQIASRIRAEPGTVREVLAGSERFRQQHDGRWIQAAGGDSPCS